MAGCWSGWNDGGGQGQGNSGADLGLGLDGEGRCCGRDVGREVMSVE